MRHSIRGLKRIFQFIKLFLSVSGFVPAHATIIRTIVMAFTVFLSVNLINTPSLGHVFAVCFFVSSTSAYIAFLYVVLPQNGLRLWLMRRFGEEEGFLTYEAILSFLFFVNGASIGYISLAFKDSLPFTVDKDILQSTSFVLFIAGWFIKLWAAKVVGVDIYYWKDMFYGKKITEFVVEGPYKFISNPMYGLGQMQSYATALWYLPFPGFIAAIINQLAVFSFYQLHEKKFIKSVYLEDASEEHKSTVTAATV
jgi:protein-S-isoprenylcysteine O-methyltransferase Ste14